MRRRSLLKAGLAGLAAGALGVPVRADATPETLVEAARALAAAPWRSGRMTLPPPFDTLSYDAYRGIRPRPGGAGRIPLGADWVGELLPPGWLFPDPVAIDLPGREGMEFDPALYDFDPRYFPTAPQGPMPDLAFSGLRLMAPINGAHLDEVLVLQGASYFRALARGAAWGLSARALALGTGGAAPEEFPVSKRMAVFGVSGATLEMGCLIDSPSASGALLVGLTHGTADAPETIMDCTLHLFPRVPLDQAGIAPLTSMFLKNDLGPARIDDFRPAVHDSDALVIDNGAGERLWRPLGNPLRPQLSAFADTGPRRYGLVQTPDAFDRFRDAEAAYHRRPTAWVEPQGDWGAGAVMLLELPTADEYADNIGAFWRPAAPLEPGRAHRFDYRLTWAPAGLAATPLRNLWLPARAGSGIEPTRRDGRLYVIDYAPGPLGGPRPAPEALALDIAPVSGVQVLGAVVYPLEPEPGHLRASFVLVPEPGIDTAELRVVLRNGAEGRPVAPVWLSRWDRTADGGP
jgi:glucans biosynthesis protein